VCWPPRWTSWAMEQYDQQKGGVRVLPATSQLLLVVVCVCVRSATSGTFGVSWMQMQNL
jgi:hypothetical protein